ncbi:hypothetical protein O6H91_01G046700 [Diphasiastrum complanatum]|uniref:Uncharacterized protein n=1 Tax=Diphasiastrum complanatum TaxID=34168 RepID=A0ACC2EQT8_DIPCM|nr:hypothetical protein O6H91_01G046700 [Diphasiastrum complanatum]
MDFVVGLSKTQWQNDSIWFVVHGEFITHMQQMLELAKENVRAAMDRAKTYVDLDRTQREFEERDMVFLKISKDSKIFNTRKCYKLSPRYYGPWKIVRKTNSIAYELDMSINCKVHPVFHVSCLKVLHDGDNLLTNGVVLFQEHGEVMHGPSKVLDWR